MKLINHLKHFMQKQNQSFKMIVYFIEQSNNEPFNRARLFNIGLRLSINNSACIIIHDIDMLPDEGVDYTDCNTPIQLSSELHHWGDSVPYATYTGGVVSASPEHWLLINGMSNTFVGWGGEDDELYHRFRKSKLLSPDTGLIRRPAKGGGRYHALNDEHHTERKQSSRYSEMVKQIERASRDEIDFSQDGLSTNSDKIIIQNKTMQHISENLYTNHIYALW